MQKTNIAKIKKVYGMRVFAILVFFLSCFSIIPFFHKGFIATDDGTWMVIRFSAFHQAFVHGQIPTRFLPRLNFEYGYPVANFLYPGFMYLAEPIHLLKVNFVNTIKIIFAGSLISSALFTYFWLSKHVKKLAAVTGSLIYLYSPYHLIDTYTRGSLGEVLALATLPFILWMIDEENIFFTGIGVGFLILAHNTLAALFLPIIIMYLVIKIVHKKEKKRYMISSILLGLGLATFFWLPAIYDLQSTIFRQTKISDWHQYFTNINEIGVLNIGIFILAVITTIITLSKGKSDKILTVFFLILTGGAIFLSLPISSFIWNFLPVSIIQFPFRILSIELIGIAFISAMLLDMLKEKLSIIATMLLIVIIMSTASTILSQVHYQEKEEGFYTTNEDTTTVKNEYMPKWVKILPDKRPEKKIIDNQAQILNEIDTINKIVFEVQAKKTTLATINLIYFPGWIAKIDGKQTEIRYNNLRGLIEIPITAGKHTVNVFFKETPIRLMADLISIISLICLIITSLLVKKPRIGQITKQKN